MACRVLIEPGSPVCCVRLAIVGRGLHYRRGNPETLSCHALKGLACFGYSGVEPGSEDAMFANALNVAARLTQDFGLLLDARWKRRSEWSDLI